MKKTVAVEMVNEIVKVNVAYTYVSKFDGNYNIFYCFENMDGINYVFNSKCPLEFSNEPIAKGDEIYISFTKKGVTEYKGQEQVKIAKVEIKDRIYREDRWEEIRERKRQEKIEFYKEKEMRQRLSITPLDTVKRVSYKVYKNKFSECETIANSYDDVSRTIEIIIRG